LHNLYYVIVVHCNSKILLRCYLRTDFCIWKSNYRCRSVSLLLLLRSCFC